MIPHDHIKLIADLSQTVLDHPEPDQFLAHLTNKTLALIDARGAILGIVEREGFLDLRGSYGFSQNIVEPFNRIPLWTAVPITDAVRTGDISIFSTPREMITRYPHLENFSDVKEGITISAPLRSRNTVLGAIGITSLKMPESGFEDSDFTQALLALCGLYIKNLLAEKNGAVKDHSSSMKSLTSRQKEIIRLFKEDLTTDQMAERLKYSSSTIKQDIIKIYSIFGVNNRTAVIELADKVGL